MLNLLSNKVQFNMLVEDGITSLWIKLVNQDEKVKFELWVKDYIKSMPNVKLYDNLLIAAQTKQRIDMFSKTVCLFFFILIIFCWINMFATSIIKRELFLKRDSILIKLGMMKSDIQKIYLNEVIILTVVASILAVFGAFVVLKIVFGFNDSAAFQLMFNVSIWRIITMVILCNFGVILLGNKVLPVN